ncbi:hypothetical protein C8R47DRAFT_166940 [Mycena vitilis]|nr:hypothetical protein C8R47DRAFT_166940 [Mycena vitilis]
MLEVWLRWRVIHVWITCGPPATPSGQKREFPASTSILAAQSSAFRDVAEFPQPQDGYGEMIEGSPVVNLSHSAADVEAFLSAIFEVRLQRFAKTIAVLNHRKLLDLVPVEVLPGHRRVSLAALCIFADNCPDLVYLGIELNARKIPAPQPDSEQRRIHTSLKNVMLGHSPIDNTIAVAEFLSDVFPGLLVIKTRQMYVNREPGDHR